jgi:hypothetical protein
VKLFCSNQENAAYPSGLCAERVAIFMQVPFIQQQNFENGNQQLGYQPNYYPYSAPVVLADNLLQSMKSSRKHLLRFILWEKLFINLIP